MKMEGHQVLGWPYQLDLAHLSVTSCEKLKNIGFNSKVVEIIKIKLDTWIESLCKNETLMNIYLPTISSNESCVKPKSINKNKKHAY